MLHRILKVLFVFMLVVAIGTSVMAQRQTGSISGKVTDEEGIPLPGVSVTVNGTALMGALAFTTSGEGSFRFPALRPGRDYVVTAELSGFNTVKRGGIIVSVGKNVAIAIELTAATLTEEVVVTAETPTVDVTSSKISVNYSADLINNIPLARDYYDIITTIPGVVSDRAELRTFSSHGGSARMNQVAVDGINISDSALGENKIAVPFDAFEEIEFELGFHSAEVAIADGAYVNIVTKAGGNQFHGGANVYFFNDSMTKSLIPQSEAEAVGLTSPTGFKSWGDISLSIGGPIVRDKLWFYLNGRYIDWTRESENFEGVIEGPHNEIQTFAKFTFKPHPNWKFSGVWKYTHMKEDIYGGAVDYFTSVDRTTHIPNYNDNAILAMVNWIVNQNTFFDLKFTYSSWFEPDHMQPGTDPLAPGLNDLYTGFYTVAPFFAQELDADKYQFGLSVTRFLDGVLGGDHELKAGIEYEKSYFRYEPFKAYPVMRLTWAGDVWLPFLPFPGGIFVTSTNGAEVGDFPVYPDTWRISGYLQDSFTIANRLTLNLGIRYDEMHANANMSKSGTVTPALASDPVFVNMFPDIFTSHTMPDQPDVIVWKEFAPRLGAVYDLFGDGSTSIKVSWARYNESFITDYYFLVSPVPSWFVTTWIDVNMNRELDVFDFYLPEREPRNPSTYRGSDYIDPNLQSPLTDEFIVGIERELVKDFSVGLSYIYKRKTRINEGIDLYRGNDPDGEWWVPYTVTDPGWDGEFGTADDSQLTVYGVKTGAPPYEMGITNPRDAERKYHGVEFVFQKRMSNRWQLLGSLTLSKFEGNVGASYNWSGGGSRVLENPNGYINAYGRLDMDRPVQIKLQGSVQLPLDFMLSAYYFHVSGVPWNRTLSVYLPVFVDPRFDVSQESPVIVNAETLGMRRLQSRDSLDVRIEKSFNTGSFGRFGIFLDVMNVLGENWYEIEQDPDGSIFPDGSYLPNPNYGRHVSAHGLRTFKLSARFTF